MIRRMLPALVFSFAYALSAAADLTPPGEVQSSFESPRHSVDEICSLPRILDAEKSLETGTEKHLPFSSLDMKSTRKVCGADFYDTRESTEEITAAVVCPKLGSTNPSVMLHELPFGMSRADFIARECPKPKKRAGDTIAKFKQSVSCSYTPAILAYPRIARTLRSEIEFPFTAYRSMDRREHLEIATRAKDMAARIAGYDSLIAQTWRMIYRDDANPAASSRRNVLFKENDSLIFGALVPDTKGDEIYYVANGSTRGDRVANFQSTAAFRMVTNPSPVSSWGVPRTFSKETAQKLILLREMGDLIILDTLLNQADRFGNLHYRPHYVRMESNGSLSWVLAKKKKKGDMTPEERERSKREFIPDPKQEAELTAQGYHRIDRMLLADNDCGVAKENRMANANGGRGIAPLLTHLHVDTYLGIRRMQKLAEQGLLANYLKKELLFLDRDVRSVQANLASLAKMLRERCLGGRLFLDADLAQHLGAKPAVDSVAFCRTAP